MRFTREKNKEKRRGRVFINVEEFTKEEIEKLKAKGKVLHLKR